MMTPVVSEPSPLIIEQVPIVEVASSSEAYIKDRIKHYAELYSVSEEVMNVVVKCESSYNPNAVGDGGRSFGLVQIHLPSHPQVSEAEALEIGFSLNFLADNLSKGQGRMWTCYRMFYGNP